MNSKQWCARAGSYQLQKTNLYISSQLQVQWYSVGKLEICYSGSIYTTGIGIVTSHGSVPPGELFAKHFTVCNCNLSICNKKRPHIYQHTIDFKLQFSSGTNGSLKKPNLNKILWLPFLDCIFCLGEVWFTFCSYRVGHPQIPVEILSLQILVEYLLLSMWPLCLFTTCDNCWSWSGYFYKSN